MYPIERIRADFPILSTKMHGHPLVYVDNGATTQRPSAVIACLDRYGRQMHAPVHRSVYQLAAMATEAYEQARKTVASFLHAKTADEIVFVRGATEAINLVADSLAHSYLPHVTGLKNGFQAGDVILVSTMAHHANIVPWQRLCERIGVVLKVIPLQADGALDLEAYQSLLCKHPVKLVSVLHVSNVLGTVNPIAHMIDLAHQHGALFLVDGAQMAPHGAVDVQDLDCDFYVFSGHKTYGPTGIGVFYGKFAHLLAMQPYQTGGAMIETVSFEKTRYAPPPKRFEAGTPHIAGVLGLAVALDYLKDIGMESIASHEAQLGTYLERGLRALKYVSVLGEPDHRAALLSVQVDGVHPHDLATFLDCQGIAARAGHHCAMPLLAHYGVPALLRFSMGIYNTMEEMDRILNALEDAIKALRHHG